MHTAALPHERRHDAPRTRAARRGTASSSTHPASRTPRPPAGPTGPAARNRRGTDGLVRHDTPAAHGAVHLAGRSVAGARGTVSVVGRDAPGTRGAGDLARQDAVAEPSTAPAEAAVDAPATAPRPTPTGVALIVPAADDRTSWAGRARTLARLSRGRLAGASEAGMATAEYAIATVAAVGFAGLLVVVLRSGEVKGLLTGLIRGALSV